MPKMTYFGNIQYSIYFLTWYSQMPIERLILLFFTMVEEILNFDTLRCPGTTYFGTFNLYHKWGNFEFWYSQMSRNNFFWYFLSPPWLKKFCNLILSVSPRSPHFGDILILSDALRMAYFCEIHLHHSWRWFEISYPS